MQDLQDAWKKMILQWYPDINTKSYFVPPVFLNRIPHKVMTVADQPVLVQQGINGMETSLRCIADDQPVHVKCKNTNHFTQSKLAPPNHGHDEFQDQCASPDVLQKLNIVLKRSLPVNFNLSGECGQLPSGYHLNLHESTAGRLWTSPEARAKPIRVQESDVRDDFAQQHVLFCLREFARRKKKVLFVISQLRFSDYLAKASYAATEQFFLRPKHLESQYRRGEFDILIIHPRRGIIIGEIKSVLSNKECFKRTQDDVDSDIIARLRKAISALNRSELVIRELTKDLGPVLIAKTVILPYVSRADLQRVLSKDHQLGQDLIDCVAKGQNIEHALDGCLLEDELSAHQSPWRVQQLQTWWTQHVSKSEDSLNMSFDVYLTLVARFCGPATTVTVHCVTPPRLEIRTSGDAVSAVGEKMALITLTPEQMDLLTRAPPRLLVTGPPGTGKSITLALMAISWVKQGHTVHVVSVDELNFAVSYLLFQTVRMTLSQNQKIAEEKVKVQFHSFNLLSGSAVNDALDRLTTASMHEESLHAICDEVFTSCYFKHFSRFVEELFSRLPNIHIWMASPWSDVTVLSQLKVEVEFMTTSLRCPPAVMTEIQQGIQCFSKMYPYSQTLVTSVVEGAGVIRLRHLGPLHRRRLTEDCHVCGLGVAHVLRCLGVGHDFRTNRNNSYLPSTLSVNTNTAKSRVKLSPPPLQYRDVFILTFNDRTSDYVIDDNNYVHSDVTDNDGHIDGNNHVHSHVTDNDGHIDDNNYIHSHVTDKDGHIDDNNYVHSDVTGNDGHIDDFVTDYNRRRKTNSGGFVRALCDARIPVHVVRTENAVKDLQDIAMAHTNMVTLTRFGLVSGLERKVVVWLGGSDQMYENVGKLLAMSRSTSQLVIVEAPILPMDVTDWKCLPLSAK